MGNVKAVYTLKVRNSEIFLFYFFNFQLFFKVYLFFLMFLFRSALALKWETGKNKKRGRRFERDKIGGAYGCPLLVVRGEGAGLRCYFNSFIRRSFLLVDFIFDAF